MNHVLLTRFNLPSAGVEGLARARRRWLERRVELFDRYCLPSVLVQTSRRFIWVLYLDPESPEWSKRRVAADAEAGHYVPLFRPEVSREDLVADRAALFPSRDRTLITTNLDNDDSLAADFVERVQSQAVRLGRDRTRSVVKSVVMRCLGRDALGRTKLTLRRAAAIVPTRRLH